MKKSLLAAAFLAAFGQAAVADVTLYGTIDMGLSYLHQNNGTETFKLADSQQTMNRLGLKGSESLGNGYKVGFILENGYSSTTGGFADSKRLFNREATLYVETPYGKLGAGRIGELRSGNGSWCLYGAAIAPFSTAWGDAVPGHKAVMAGGFGRLDNAIAYKTPTVGGVTFYAQYSGNTDDTSTAQQNTTKQNRYYSAAVTYRNGPLYTVLIADKLDTKSFGVTGVVHDPVTVSAAVTYESSIGKLYFDAQYFKEARLGRNAVKAGGFGGQGAVNGYADGFGVNLGIQSKVAGGSLYANIGYMDAENTDDSSDTLNRYIAAVGYEYFLSKATSVYAGAGYYQDVYGNASGVSDGKSFNAVGGMVYRF